MQVETIATLAVGHRFRREQAITLVLGGKINLLHPKQRKCTVPIPGTGFLQQGKTMTIMTTSS